MVTYLPHDEAEAIILSYNNKAMLNYIKSEEKMSAEAIATYIASKFGIPIKPLQVLFIFVNISNEILDNYNKEMFTNAYQNSTGKKVRVDHVTTSNNTFMKYYYSWNGDYVNNSPLEDYGATFYRDNITLM